MHLQQPFVYRARSQQAFQTTRERDGKLTTVREARLAFAFRIPSKSFGLKVGFNFTIWL
jgi:hypothetical protein